MLAQQGPPALLDALVGPALGFGAALTWGVVDVVVAMLARRANPLTVTLAVHASGVCVLVILALALGETRA